MRMVSLPGRSGDGRKALVSRSMFVLLLALAFAPWLVQFTFTAWGAALLIRYPFGVDYGEGIVWQQMLNIVAGKGYAPLGTFPAIVYHYPPVFHVAAAGLSTVTGLDGLAAGRIISWIATLGTAVVTAWLVWLMQEDERDPLLRALPSIAAALIFMSMEPVIEWAATMRVDMLAGLFGMAGLALALRAVKRPGWIHGAGVMFVLAIFTKQVSIAAPFAAFLGLLVVRPSLAVRLMAGCMIMGALVLVLLSWATDGGFLRHIVLYNINRFRPDMISGLIDPIQVHGVYLAFAGAGTWRLFRDLRRTDLKDDNPTVVAGATMALSFLLIKTAMLSMLMKSGACTNYLVEWCNAVAIAAAFGLVPSFRVAIGMVRGSQTTGPSPLFAACLLVLLAAQTTNLIRRRADPIASMPPTNTMWQLTDLIRHQTKPVIADEMTLLIRAGRPVEWEPAITAELGAQGRYDEAGFIRLVRAHRFALFINAGGPGNRVFDSRYNPDVLAAMQSAYPVVRRDHGFFIRSPDGDD